MNRIAIHFSIAFAFIFGLATNANAQMSCDSLFTPPSWIQTKRGHYANGQIAQVRYPSVLEIESNFHRATAVLKWDGSFDVFVAPDGLGERTKRLFNSKPSVLKTLNPLNHRYSHDFIAYPNPRVGLKPLPFVFLSVNHELLFHGQGDLTRLDVWKAPFRKPPREIDVHNVLFGRHREANEEIGYISNRNAIGLYAKFGGPVPWTKPVIGETAFLAPIHQNGIVYGLYEILDSWSGRRYFHQRTVLLQFDLRNGTVLEMGEYRADPSEDHRAQNFKILDQTWRSIQVIGVMKDGTEHVLIDAPIPKPLGPPNRKFNVDSP